MCYNAFLLILCCCEDGLLPIVRDFVKKWLCFFF
ncbi:hypothetical protein KP509_04G003100 [Ceratopteris richardii]|uniref:Uncharacterized protein n=1 Tax=Ceratopteris richardii TaxID=49495 RepID=A0A8T2UU43_CERRI|nr:hypothetical protein KP509_04G003100 [Ceratopteris richardii]